VATHASAVSGRIVPWKAGTSANHSNGGRRSRLRTPNRNVATPRPLERFSGSVGPGLRPVNADLPWPKGASAPEWGCPDGGPPKGPPGDPSGNSAARHPHRAAVWSVREVRDSAVAIGEDR
jgi:hypothetical protein